MERFIELVASLLAVIVVLSFHEFAHAYVAYKCGDLTAKFAGRMTLNPIKHFDPIGSLMFAIAHFGWAKPVPINPYNFNNYKKGCFWTSAAGVLINYAMAFVFYPILVIGLNYLLPIIPTLKAQIFIFYLLTYLYVYSLNCCVFNLIPVYPLDGFRMMDAISKKKGKVYWFLRQYGSYVLMGLLVISLGVDYHILPGYLDVLGYLMSFANNILGWPIMKLWGLIFGVIF